MLFKTQNDIPESRSMRLKRQVNGNAGTRNAETPEARAARIERFRRRVSASVRRTSQQLDLAAEYFHNQRRLAELRSPAQQEYERNKAALAALASNAPKRSL